MNYKNSWKKFKKFEITYISLLILFFPYMILVQVISKKIGLNNKFFMLTFFLIWGIGFVVSINKVYGWKCPKCGKNFFYKSYFARGLPKFWITSCRHCGLKKYSSS